MSLIAELEAALGPQGCLHGDRVPEAARSDASRTGAALPALLLRPASVAEISAALSICARHGMAVTPQGGMTGLAGGANPRAGDAALSLARFAGVEEIDAAAGVMTVRAGTVLETAQRAAAEAGWQLPVDLGARGSAQIGGLLATNAGGLRVIRFGSTRDNVLGIEAVMPDGTVLSHLNRSVKDNTGYDLRGLLVGSEGTLGVIARATLRLHPPLRLRPAALCALPGFDATQELLRRARSAGGLAAFEAMWPEYFDLLSELEGRSFFDGTPPVAVLLEMESDPEALLAAALEDGVVTDALIARSEADARRFWDVREGHRLDSAFPSLITLDVSLAQGAMDAFVTGCGDRLKARFPGVFAGFFGHVGDGNLHAVVHLPEEGEEARHEAEAIAYGLVRDLGGSVSAEHGIGTLKRDWLPYSRTPQEIAAMRAIKAALDPAGMMNPGKILG